MEYAKQFVPSAGFYLLALAAQVSGYTNPTVAVCLVVVATILLMLPAWHYLNRKFSFQAPLRRRESSTEAMEIAVAALGGHRQQEPEIWDKRISLLGAARRAYSETEDSTYAILARQVAGPGARRGTPDDILVFYANGIKNECTIIGCRLPSDTPKQHDLKEFKIEMRDDDMIAVEIYGTTVINRLTISEHDLLWFIQYARGFAGNEDEINEHKN